MIQARVLPVDTGDGHAAELIARVPAAPRMRLLWLPAMGVAAISASSSRYPQSPSRPARRVLEPLPRHSCRKTATPRAASASASGR